MLTVCKEKLTSTKKLPSQDSAQCLHQLFEEQVSRDPNKIAVFCKGEFLTYEELNQRANQVAHYLRELGVRPGVLVVIDIERSTHLLVGLLGIVKSGGAYVPLDPDSPEARNFYILKDTGSQFLLTTRKNRKKFTGYEGKIVNLEDILILSVANHKVNPQSVNVLRDLVYVIYTSGSTGHPKGVMIKHGSVVNLLHSFSKSLSISEHDRFFAVTKISFDISFIELFLPIVNGAQAVIASADVLANGFELGKAIDRIGATIMQATPATWSMLLELGWSCKKDFKIMCGGDTLIENLARALLKSSKEVWNLYGPTETTVWSAAEKIAPHFEKITIGEAIDNTEIVILDEQQNPVPMGAIGEICIGGEGLARGYLNLEKLTAEKFLNVSAPFKYKRLYRTGDLGRMLPNGKIEFLGRIDQQIKMRGFRIELIEIEKAIAEFPSVEQAVVVLNEKGKRKFLVAFLLLSSSDTIFDKDLLNSQLKKILPYYMIPSVYQIVRSFPVNVNGKIDREKLLQSMEEPSQKEVTGLEERNETEQRLVDVFSEALEIKMIDVDDNIFELGADSILIMKMVNLASQKGIALKPSMLFECPSARELAKIVEEKNTPIIPAEKIKENKRNGSVYPLSSLQQGILLHSLESPCSPVYFMQYFWQFDGELHLDVMKEAWDLLLKKYSILRSCIRWRDVDCPLQIVNKSVELPWRVYDWSPLSKEEQSERFNDFLKRDKEKSINIEEIPLMRIAVMKLAENSYQFVWSLHHILVDGWSVESLMNEVHSIYRNLLFNQPILESKETVPFGEFVLWLKKKNLDESERFWKAYLKDFEPVSPLKNISETVSVDDEKCKFEEETFLLEKMLDDEISHFSKSKHITSNILLQSAWAYLEGFYTKSNDVVLGTTVSLRMGGLERTEDQIGLLINTLPIRFKIKANLSVIDFLQEVTKSIFEVMDHSFAPLEKIKEWLRIRADVKLFHSLFSYENTCEDYVNRNLLNIRNFELKTETHYPITLVINHEDIHKFKLIYNSSFYKRNDILSMIRHFKNIVSQFLRDSNQKLVAIDLLDREERKKIVHSFNQTKSDYPREKTILSLIEERLAKNPGKTIVTFQNRELSYSDLNQKAEQLARRLIENGASKGDIIGILAERSLEMIVGIFGILKMGAAYLPLNPEHPEERLAFMVEDADVTILVKQENDSYSLVERNRKVIQLNLEEEKNGYRQIENFSCRVSPEDTAYVIYTSGSTGQPKGVCCNHRGLLNRLWWMQKEYNIGENDRILQKTPFDFDVSIWELLLPLLSGAKLVFAEPGAHRDPQGLINAIKAEEITIIHFVPSMFQLFLANEAVGQCTSLKRVFCSGETLSRKLEKEFFQKLNANLSNLYGPTEASIDVTYWNCKRDSQLDFVPIGKPIQNTQLYVLNQWQMPVPIGVTGELYIGGEGLSDGYLNREELNREKFMSNPFGEGRLYATGDIVRWLPDGSLEFIERMDNQVKIGGNRVELQEIEAILQESSMVENCVVVANNKNPENVYLAAYVVADKKHNLNQLSAQIRQYLEKKLPCYMIPSRFIFLESLPLKANGKFDKNALLEVNEECVVTRKQEAPITPTEKVLVPIWMKVLNLKKVGINDTLFDLGGQSLMAIRMVVEIKRAFDIDLNVRAIFQLQTIAKLGEFLDKMKFHVDHRKKTKV